MRTLIPAFVLALNCFAQAPLVKGVGNFIHNVSDLDQSMKFYRDVLGMESPRPPGDFQATEAVLKLYNAVGGSFRVGNAQVTGVAMRIELAEFKGVERKPVKRALGEPGASLLLLYVADLQPVIERLNAAKVPLAVKLTEACDGRGIATADPDGFPVVIMQRKGAEPITGRNFIGLRFGYTVSNDDVVNGPFKALGLAGERRTNICQPIEEAVLSTIAPVTVKLPDGFEILLVKSAPGKKAAGVTRPQDPGAAVLRLSVVNAEAAAQALTQSGTEIVSEGGGLQTLSPAGMKAGILKAPDNLFIQVIQ
jgi:catechol 2,3-dioxygenase-like lactoylglutathione lyase family enzyme